MSLQKFFQKDQHFLGLFKMFPGSSCIIVSFLHMESIFLKKNTFASDGHPDNHAHKCTNRTMETLDLALTRVSICVCTLQIFKFAGKLHTMSSVATANDHINRSGRGGGPIGNNSVADALSSFSSFSVSSLNNGDNVGGSTDCLPGYYHNGNSGSFSHEILITGDGGSLFVDNNDSIERQLFNDDVHPHPGAPLRPSTSYQINSFYNSHIDQAPHSSNGECRRSDQSHEFDYNSRYEDDGHHSKAYVQKIILDCQRERAVLQQHVQDTRQQLDGLQLRIHGAAPKNKPIYICVCVVYIIFHLPHANLSCFL